MKLTHEQVLCAPRSITHKEEATGDQWTLCLQRIDCMCVSSDLGKLAVCNGASNCVQLYDMTTNEEKDKFALRANVIAKSAASSEQGSSPQAKRKFVVAGMCFSTDSQKLAIGQSDCVIYVYKIGTGWGVKKTIVNKYNLASPVVALHWLPAGLLFSSIDGRVKLIQSGSSKISSVLSGNSVCVSLAYNQNQVVAAFYSGLILVNNVEAREASSCKQVCTHSCAPFALALTTTNFVAAGGDDGRVLFHQLWSPDGGPVPTSDSLLSGHSKHSTDSSHSLARQTIEVAAELSTATCSPSGTIVVFGSTDRLLLFELESRAWRLKMSVKLAGTLLVTNVTFSPDGTRLLASSLNGSLNLLRVRYLTRIVDSRFEINFIGPRQLAITDLVTRQSAQFASRSSDITDVRILRQSFAIVWTVNSLIIGSLSEPSLRSEIEWQRGSNSSAVRFSFDYPNVVLIAAVGELFLVELGGDTILGSVRTDYVSPHMLSLRINDERNSLVKMLAYLLDAKTISVLDLTTGSQLCTWSHNERIDWLELNETGNKLIYRDKALKLVLLDIVEQEFAILLNLCGFVQWVPFTNVIVAQSKHRLYVWYDLTRPVVLPVPGVEPNEAKEIVRTQAKTIVKLSQAGTDVELDQVLLEFDTALDEGDLERAEAYLESLQDGDHSPSGSVPLWLQLGKQALREGQFSVAQRAFAATGDIAKVTFIKACEQDNSLTPLLQNDWRRFESADLHKVLDTYLATHNWERAIAVAKKHSRTDLLADIEQRYYQWLVQSGQSSMAASLLEKWGKTEQAIAMYLRSGRTLRATKLILNHSDTQLGARSSGLITAEMVRNVLDELQRKQAFEEAGDLYQLELVRDEQAALRCYVQAAAYAKAILLAKKSFPDQVVSLEKQYGEYLLNEQNDPASAVTHLIEAGQTERAVEAAIAARQYDRAAEIASVLDRVPPYLANKIAHHYAARDQVEPALEMYLAADCVREAVHMLNAKGQFARAFKMAKKLMKADEANEMYEYIANGYEREGKLAEAEKIYLACGDVDSAISMYKRAKQFENMLRLVKVHHPNLLAETSVHLAKELQAERKFKQAESYFVSAQEWKQAVVMYRDAQMWEDAYRVSRAHGGASAAKQVAYHWAQTLPSPVEAVSLLNRYGLLNQVVEYAVETNGFEFALPLIAAAGAEMKHKLVDVQLKFALYLESEGRWHEAESMFVEAGKPREAVLMYLHTNAFEEALRVAESYMPHDEEVVKDVLTAQANFLFERDKPQANTLHTSASLNTTLAKVESLLLRAGRIEVAIRLYKDAGLWNEAVRACEQFAPHLVEPLKREMIHEAQQSSLGSQVYYQQTGFGSQAMLEGEHVTDSGGADVTEMRTSQVDLQHALKVAEQNDDKEAIIRCAILLATQLLKDRLTLESLQMLRKHDTALILVDSKKLLSRIAVIILSELEDFTWAGVLPTANGVDQEEEEEEEISDTATRIAIYSSLRDCLLQLLSINNSISANERDLFERYLLISHYLALKSVLESMLHSPSSANLQSTANVRELHLKIRVALLRYTDVIRADKAFYEAGKACRNSKRLEMAFVFFNHLLDLVEAIEEHDYNVDHSDFVGTDIPYEVPLPARLYYSSQTVEQIKSWILEMSMDTQLSQTLPIDALRDGDVYEASLFNADGTRSLPCLVTGYPVIRHKAIDFKPAKWAANKEDWNKLLMLAKVTQNEELRQVLHFIGRLCGNSAVVKFSFQ